MIIIYLLFLGTPSTDVQLVLSLGREMFELLLKFCVAYFKAQLKLPQLVNVLHIVCGKSQCLCES